MSSGEEIVGDRHPAAANAPSAGEISRYLDLRGLPRPLPVAIASNSLQEMERGQLLCVLTSDPAALEEFRQLAASGATLHLVTQETRPDGHLHILRRRPG
jgi:TusA-related sulfurtransferase